MAKENLLAETLADLAANGKSAKDVLWVGSHDGRYAISWAEFAAIAENTNYDSGFGGNEIAMELVIVGADWWLERHEYDGAECFRFKTMPRRRDNAEKFNRVMNDNYDDTLSYVVQP